MNRQESSFTHSAGASLPRALVATVLAFAAILAVPALATTHSPAARNARSHRVLAARSKAVASYAKLPISFEPNRGQANSHVKFLARSRGATIFLEPAQATLVLARAKAATVEKISNRDDPGAMNPKVTPKVVDTSAVSIRFLGAEHHAAIEGAHPLPGVSNYFVGNDRAKWRTRIPNYAKVEYVSLYPGIDAVFYGSRGRFEYDLVVSPGANARRIRLALDGARKLAVNSSGDLVIQLREGRITLHRPIAYQEVNGTKHAVSTTYRLLGGDRVAIELARYNHRAALRIDPVLSYSTYLGGSIIDIANSVKVDSFGSAYLTGFTCSGNFPVLNPEQGSAKGGCDAFVTKLNAAGNAVVYSTYLGGFSFDEGVGIAVDHSGAAYVAGETFSGDFPVTTGAAFAGQYDAFAAKLSPDGATLAYSRLLGGSTPTTSDPNVHVGWTYAAAVAVPQGCSSNCNAYLTGQTTVADYPVTSGSFQGTYQNAFNAFVTEISADGTQLVASTYFAGPPGPNNDGTATWGGGIAVDGSGDAFIAGQADIATLPVTTGPAYGGTSDCYVAEFNSSLSGLVYATYLGGTSHEQCQAIAIPQGCGSNCDAYVTGETWSLDFPTTAGALQQAFGLIQSAFVTKFNANGSIDYSTYLGGPSYGSAISVDSAGSAYVAGWAWYNNFPLVNQLQGKGGPSADLFDTTDGTNYGSLDLPSSATAVTDISVDSSGSNIYVGTIENGIWKSSDSGSTFTQIGFTGQSAGVIVDPQDPSTLYVATLGGQFKSTDGGSSFSPTVFNGGIIRSMAFDTSTTPSSFYVGTQSQGVFKSTDGGKTFTSIPGTPYAEVLSMAVDPNDPATVYAGTGAGLYMRSNFQSTGNMTTPRAENLTVTLADGRVLTMGGVSGFLGNNANLLSSAEIFDPSTGTWSATGSMALPRVFGAAVTLPSGKVLVVGGFPTFWAWTDEAELYDPGSGTFSQIGPMNETRGYPTATLLQNGTVLIAGGGNTLNAEIYDPSTNTFTYTGAMTIFRQNHTATLLPNGKVLLVGGEDASVSTVYGSAELYDPSTGTFTATGSMSVPRQSQTATLLPDGKVLIAGGSSDVSGSVALASAEIYDPATGQFTPTGSMNLAREYHASNLLPSGLVLIAGGFDPNRGMLPMQAELYDPSSGEFSLTSMLNVGRNHVGRTGADAQLPDGRIVFAGSNFGSSYPASQAAEIYDPDSAPFRATSVDWSPVLSLAIDSTSTPSQVYAGTQFQGVAKSNGGFGTCLGCSGFALLNYGPGTGFFSLAVDTSTTPGILYAGSTNGQILRSTDGGNTFSFAAPGNGKAGNLNALAVAPNGAVYAALFREADAFVAKLNPSGSALMFSSYLGGSGFDAAESVAADASGTSAYVTGLTDSPDFPVANAYQQSLPGIINGFVTKIGQIAIPVTIEVKPPSTAPVSINLSSAGVIPVAILSTPSFDATQIDPSTVSLSGAQVHLIGKSGNYSCSTQDVNSDGIPDLLCQVSTDQLQLQTGADVVTLTAQTTAGVAVQGQEGIQIVPQ